MCLLCIVAYEVGEISAAVNVLLQVDKLCEQTSYVCTYVCLCQISENVVRIRYDCTCTYVQYVMYVHTYAGPYTGFTEGGYIKGTL